MEMKKDIISKINNIKETNENQINKNNKNAYVNKIEERRNRFSGLTSYELLKIVKQTSGFPKNLSSNIPLETLVNFYNRFWNGDVSDDESDTSSSGNY
jgi:hypothetical protein